MGEEDKSEVKDANAENPNYRRDTETGELFYKDPASQIEYIWDTSKNSWKKVTPSVKSDESDEKEIDYEFDGQTYIHTDSNGTKFKWSQDKNEWVKYVESESEESEEDENTTDAQRKARMFRKRKAAPGWDNAQANYFKDPDSGVQLYKDPQDGMTYEWDADKKAWFPRINEDFVAQYQMNYGFTKDGVAEPTKPEEKIEAEQASAGKEQKKPGKNDSNKKPEWFDADSEKTTKVYVSGLPDGPPDSNWNEEEFAKYMSKCGVIDIDVRSNKPKVKLYKDEEGNLKGDGLCTYVKVESVQLAQTIIDGASIKAGTVIKVQKAKFEMKGNYNPKLKPKKLSKKELERRNKKHEKMLAWEPDKLRGERSKRDKVVVIENVFDPQDFDTDASLILECSTKLREHCGKFGTVRKVVVYDKHPQGICQVFFASPEEADISISMLDGRIFAKNKIMKAYTWDGKTKYKINETEEEEKERLANWDKFLSTTEASAADS